MEKEKELYVIGGRQQSPRPILADDQNWYAYQKGIIVRVNFDHGVIKPDIETCVEYVSPPEVRAPGDPILFKAGTFQDGRLYVCTQTEILIYTLPGFDRVGYLSLPFFNDVHHVCPTPEGNLLVAVSGLEMVLEIDVQGQILRAWNVLGEDPWGRFSKEIDYRRGVNLKPHRAHPNHVFYVGDDIWVTRFEQKDLLCLTRPDLRLDIGIERVHDGVYHNGRIYLTTVNGNLVIANPHSLVIENVVDLKSMHYEDTLLGWCRGLMLEGDNVWVGFTRIRPTKFREAVSWVRKGFNRELPTHIACYDLVHQRFLAGIDVERFGLNAVFSIFSAP